VVPTRTRTRWAFWPAGPDRLDQDLRDRLLQALEGRHRHLVRVDALGLDVVLGDVPQGPVEDAQVGGVVALGGPTGGARLALLGLRRGVLQGRHPQRQRE
jgi:hypothetical protein